MPLLQRTQTYEAKVLMKDLSRWSMSSLVWIFWSYLERPVALLRSPVWGTLVKSIEDGAES